MWKTTLLAAALLALSIAPAPAAADHCCGPEHLLDRLKECHVTVFEFPFPDGLHVPQVTLSCLGRSVTLP